MRYLLILLIFANCSPLRHYTKVANDPFRNEAERQLLARASLQEFPPITGQPVTTIVYDSTAYKELSAQYNLLVEDYIRHIEKEDSSGNREADTVFLTRIRALKPATIVKTVTKEIPIRNTAVENQLQTSLNACTRENDGLAIQAKTASDRRKDARKTLTFLYVISGVLLAGNLVQLFSKKRFLA